MFNRSNRKVRFSITRNWVRSRPGSVLILVIALLVLLALIGTAYLSSTQTERYTSVQNTVNTQADLLVNGLVLNVEGKITNGVNGTNGQSFRPPSSENSVNGITPATAAVPGTGYNSWDSPLYDDFLAERIPTNSLNPAASNYVGVPAWNSISWPLFTDSAAPANYSFDTPFATSSQAPTQMFGLQNKPNIVSIPTYQQINGQTYPAFLYYVLPNSKITFNPPLSDGTPSVTFLSKGGYLMAPTTANPKPYVDALTGTIKVNGVVTPMPAGPGIITASPGTYAPLLNFAASAAGDGVADAGMFKVPVGPIDGITYYAAIRVIDNNSAVNVSTAWTATTDLAPGTTPTEASITAGTPTPVYGFFRSNVGLRELLSQTSEMDGLNAYRFNRVLQPWTSSTPPSTPPFLSPDAYDDAAVAKRTDFTWFSVGDELDNQLARRSLNPGQNGAAAPGTTTTFLYFDKSQSAALASRFSLVNPNAGQSPIEQLLPNETYYKVYSSGTKFPSAPYSPTQVGPNLTTGTSWFDDLFTFHQYDSPAGVVSPLRTILTASNPVSNGIASRFGNTTTGPPVWNASSTYNFGDWLTFTNTTTGVTSSYACMIPVPKGNVITDPSTTTTDNGGDTLSYFATMPFMYQPVKASINTATFEQLWLNFCHVMTDVVTTPASGVTTVPQWQPPLMPSATLGGGYQEEQIPQFRSVIRDNRSWPISNGLSGGGSPNTGQPGSAGGASPGGGASVAASGTFTQRVQLTPMQMVQLRAAIASINTVGIRDTNTSMANHVTRSRHVVLADTSGNPAFDVEVYANDIQPFIGQMYAAVGSTGNSFLAIQLINPYLESDITLNNHWVFATIDRSKTLATANLSLTQIGVGPTTAVTIPHATFKPNAAGKMVLVPGMATVYDGPPPLHFKLPTIAIPVTGLANALGLELVILRPRSLDSTTIKSPANDPWDSFDETTTPVRLYDLVPVDQLDLSGTGTPIAGNANLYYRRGADPAIPNSATPVESSYAWNFVWPGFYTPYNKNNPTPSGPTAKPNYTPSNWPVDGPAPAYRFAQAIIASSVDPTDDPTNINPDFDKLCGGPCDPNTATFASLYPKDPLSPSYNTITLQLANTSLPGGNPVGTAPSNRFPFGGFTRNADLLQIPYIGAYRISDYNKRLGNVTQNPTNLFYEMNSVTMDASLANDSTLQPSGATPNFTTDFPYKVVPTTGGSSSPGTATADSLLDPFVEQIGHFCPVGKSDVATTPTPAAAQLDFGNDPTSPSKYWHYHWTKKLFDYFTVQAPNDDYFPNVDPDLNPQNYVSTSKYPVAPKAVKNSSGTANVGEDLVGVEGLININTAPWPVLATLPFVRRGTDLISYNAYTGTAASTPSSPAIDDNVDIAKAIADYRSANGPFKSIMDLYKVPAFRLENDAQLNAGEPGVNAGDFSPSGMPITSGGTATNAADTDGARFDFEERFLLLNQISNLITTRSDTFTCYIDLQGWRNVGTGTPTLAVERRKAFIFDRNAYSPTYKNPIYYPVP